MTPSKSVQRYKKMTDTRFFKPFKRGRKEVKELSITFNSKWTVDINKWCHLIFKNISEMFRCSKVWSLCDYLVRAMGNICTHCESFWETVVSLVQNMKIEYVGLKWDDGKPTPFLRDLMVGIGLSYSTIMKRRVLLGMMVVTHSWDTEVSK